MNASSSPSRRRLIRALEGVEGWFVIDEAWVLHERARTTRSASPVAVEIGAFHGRSSIAIGLGFSERGGGRVVSIDPHDMRPGQYESYLANIERAGIRSMVEPLISTSHEARGRIADGTVDLLFVDGSHEYADVVQDVRDWTSSLIDGASVGFNDPYDEGVGKALEDTILRDGSPFRNAVWRANTLFFDYAPSRPWTRAASRRVRRVRAYLAFGRRWHRFHWRIVTGRRAPMWFKRAQLRAAEWALGVLLPRAR